MRAIQGMALAAVALIGVSSAQADIPKGAPLTAPPSIPLSPLPALSKPAPPLPPTPKVRAKPAESPGIWINPDDYPPVALRYNMAGISGVRLFIDPHGKVSYCQIIAGSGFEVLDKAACERLIEHGRFQPARDAKGRAVADVWVSRVVWKIPNSEAPFLREITGTETLKINQMGAVIWCEMSVTTSDVNSAQNQCSTTTSSLPLSIGLEMRGYSDMPEVEVKFENSTVLSEAARNRLMLDKPGYETRSLLVFRFENDANGKTSNCVMERQVGNEKLITDFCFVMSRRLFEPMKDSQGTLLGAPVWVIHRVLRKLGP